MLAKYSLLLLALCAAACGLTHGRLHGNSAMGAAACHAGMLDLHKQHSATDHFLTPTMHSAIPHRKLLQPTANTSTTGSVCTFRNATAGLEVSRCEPNRGLYLYLANTTNLTTTASPAAVADMEITAGLAGCNRHNMSTPEGADACAADSAHHCFLFLDTNTGKLDCGSAAAYTVQPAQCCPDSISYKYTVCIASNRTSCQANPDCIWSLFGAGPVIPIVANSSVAGYEEAWRNASLALGGAHEPEFGFCQYRTQFDIATAASNGTAYEWSAKYLWEASTLFPSDRDTYYANNGNCSLAQMSFAASAYINVCGSFNKVPVSTDPEVDLGTTMMRSDLPPNVTTIQSCIEAKCVLALAYTAAVFSAPPYRPFTNYTGFYSCVADGGIVSELVYNRETDGAIWKANVECNSFDNQFDREACLSIRA